MMEKIVHEMGPQHCIVSYFQGNKLYLSYNFIFFPVSYLVILYVHVGAGFWQRPNPLNHWIVEAHWSSCELVTKYTDE